MSEPLNPYASPQDAGTSEPLPPDRTLLVRFSVGPAWRQQAARAYRLPHVFLLLATLVPLFLCMLLGFAISTEPRGRITGLWVGLAIGGLLAVAAHSACERAIFAGNRRRLAEHPILGADGDWLVAIGCEQMSVLTESGLYSAPLAEVRRFQLSGRPLVLWLPGEMPIALARDADYGDEVYATAEQAIQRRVASLLR